MRLLRDLWATSAARTAAVAVLVVLGAAGQAGASALTGKVLVDRSRSAFALLVVAVVVAVVTDLVIALLAARLTADWSADLRRRLRRGALGRAAGWAADLRRRLCRVALGQDVPTLETTPVGELLDRIDSDVYQVASELRQSGVRVTQNAATGVLATLTALVLWWPAGVVMAVVAVGLVGGLTRPLRRIAPQRERE